MVLLITVVRIKGNHIRTCIPMHVPLKGPHLNVCLSTSIFQHWMHTQAHEIYVSCDSKNTGALQTWQTLCTCMHIIQYMYDLHLYTYCNTHVYTHTCTAHVQVPATGAGSERLNDIRYYVRSQCCSLR